MTRNKLPIIPILAGLGVLAILGTVVLMRSATNSAAPGTTEGQNAPAPTPEPPKIKQWVAMQYIPPRTFITQAMLRSDQTTKPTTGAITDPNLVLGQLAAVPIFKGRAILASDVNPPLHRVVPADFEIPKGGFVAVAVFVDPNSTAAGLVDIGDRVNVILTNKTTTETQDTEAVQQMIIGTKTPVVGRTVAQNLLVLAVDRSLSAPPPTPTPDASKPNDPKEGAPPAAATPTPAPAGGAQLKTRVILAAMPETAAHLVAANESGNLHLTIRNPNSTDETEIPMAKELPSRIVEIPKQSYQDAREDRLLTQVGKLAAIRHMEKENSMPNPNMTSPMSTGNMNKIPPVPAAVPTPNAQDVTVIRGTEKTLVTVPKK